MRHGAVTALVYDVTGCDTTQGSEGVVAARKRRTPYGLLALPGGGGCLLLSAQSCTVGDLQ